MIVIGVDPGLSGAAVAVEEGRVRAYLDCPVFKPAKGKGKNSVNAAGLAAWFRKFNPRHTHVIVEGVGARPLDGPSRAFVFGEGFGIIRGVLASLEFPHSFVRPGVWKRALRLSDDKALSRRRATELFPESAELFVRALDDGRAEAALLTIYHLECERRS